MRVIALLTSAAFLSFTLFPPPVLAFVHIATQRFGYDALNRLTSASGSYGTSASAYDPLGNLTSKEGRTLTYGLADGRQPHAVTTVHGPQSTVHSLRYDANGNLLEKAVDRGPSTVDYAAQRLSYDAENRLIEVKTPREETVSVHLEPGWNLFALPVIPDDLHVTAVLPNFAQDFKYVISLEHDPAAPQTPRASYFVHHPKFNQFEHLEYGRGYQVYCTNPNGVTLTLKGKLPTKPLTRSLASGWHLLPAISSQQSAISDLFKNIVYDQVLRYDPAAGTWSAATDAQPGEALFVHVTSPSTWTPRLPHDPVTRFVYDGDGGRVKSITPAGTTIFLGDAVEIAPSGLMTQYLFVGGQRIAALDRAPHVVAQSPAPRTLSRVARWWQHLVQAIATWLDLPMVEAALPPSAVRFYHGDHLGSSNLITDGAGNIVEWNEHTPYGSLSHHEGPSDVPQKFTGQRLDSSTGLYFYHARYYDPELGRFISPDSLVPDVTNPQDLNRYTYARNNPLSYTDPSGHGWFTKIFGWVSTALSVLVPPLAPLLMAANIGLGLYSAAKTGNWMGFVGSTVGSLVGGAIGGSLGKGLGLGIASGMIQAGASRGFAGVVGGAAEFGLAGFGAGFGGALGGGASLSEAFQAGGLSAAVSGGLGAGIQGSYLAGWQNTLHGFSKGVLKRYDEIGVNYGSVGGGGVPRSGRGGSTWGNPKTLPGHFARHGVDFKAKSLADYARQASEFLQRALRQGSPTKIDSKGVIRAYDPKTNTFGSYNPDGTTRTLFKPSDAMDYWERQEGVNP